MHSNQNNHNNGKFEIEQRRRKASSLLAQSMTENEMAQEIGIDESTISKDIKALKELPQQFVFDFIKSDLAYCYKQ
jgi:predicted HTH transcriptional regulator